MASISTAEILDAIADINLGILVFDREHLQSCNRAARRMLSSADASVPDEGLWAIFQAGENLSDLCPEARERRTVQLGKTVFGFSHYTLPGERHCILIQDITERRRLEALAEALESTRSLGYIFSGVRHELGNPINSIKMTVSVLRENIDRFARENVVEYLDRILTEVGRVEYLLRSLRTFSLMDQPRIETIDAADFFARFVDLVRSDFARRGVTLQARLDPRVQEFQVDDRALHQILINLLANAADALEGRPSPQIELSVRAADESVVIAVTDNGCGIEADRLVQVFDPFFTLKRGGTGLGLTIVRRLASAMGGRIEIDSVMGKGTEFRIVLPKAGVADSVLRATRLMVSDRRTPDVRDRDDLPPRQG